MTTAWDDLAAENAWLRKEMEAMSQDILKVQCELAEFQIEYGTPAAMKEYVSGLEQALAEAKNNYDTAQEAWYSEVERRKSLEKEVERLNLEKWAYVAENRDLNTERTEDRAAIREMAEELGHHEHYDGVVRVLKKYGALIARARLPERADDGHESPR